MFFREIIGQERIKERLLTEAAENRIPHALLFTGTEGVGTFPLALAYARYISCTGKQGDDACGTCPSCVKFNKLVHPDLHFLFPIVKRKSKEVCKEVCNDYLTEWREFVLNNPYFNLNLWSNAIEAEKSPVIYTKESDEIRQKLSLKSSEGGYKIVILWLPERMDDSCANKLLKLLEEPPAKTLFFLISENPAAILPTIISRTQPINVPRIEEDLIAGALIERLNVAPAESRNIARIANGNYIKALESIRLNQEKELFFELFVSLMRFSYQRKIKEMKAWSEQVAAMGRERQKDFLIYCQQMVRENFISNFGLPALNYMTTSEQGFAARFAPFINEWNVQGMMDELSEAQQHIEQNVNAKMVFFDFTLKTIVLLKQK